MTRRYRPALYSIGKRTGKRMTHFEAVERVLVELIATNFLDSTTHMNSFVLDMDRQKWLQLT